MQKIISLLLLFIATVGFAQTNNIAYYNVEYLHSNDEKLNRFSGIFDSAEQYQDDVEIRLIFNTHTAVSISNFENRNSENRIAFNFCDCEKPVFYNLKNNTIKRKNVGHIPLNIQDGKYLITDTLMDENWTVETESKVINDFEVLKATKIKTDAEGNKILIIAWFAPEIPYSFGPNGYAGLPGLIVQVQEGNQMFTLSKIEFDQKIEIPEEPTEGEIMTTEEYKKMEYQTYLNM